MNLCLVKVGWYWPRFANACSESAEKTRRYEQHADRTHVCVSIWCNSRQE